MSHFQPYFSLISHRPPLTAVLHLPLEVHHFFFFFFNDFMGYFEDKREYDTPVLDVTESDE